jgi:hypothetical protein
MGTFRESTCLKGVQHRGCNQFIEKCNRYSWIRNYAVLMEYGFVVSE